MMTRALSAFALSLTIGAAFGTAVAAPAPKAEDDAADISAQRDKLRAYTDGKQHYIVLVPFDFSSSLFFYGTGTELWGQRAFGGSKVGDESFSRGFWDPRANGPLEAQWEFRNKQYSLTCGTRVTKFTPLSDADNKQLIEAAHFHKPLWKRQSYWLARDERGVYYFVDRLREPPGNNNFRLFVGPKGALKLQKMTNIVSDTKGDIFSTKTGDLRLVSNASDGAWVKGKQRTPLTIVSIEDNHVLVYTDLGVYTGEKLGTPCDDL